MFGMDSYFTISNLQSMFSVSSDFSKSEIFDGDLLTGAGSQIAGGFNGYGDNSNGSSAQFFNPRGIAIDPTGILYVADTGSNLIRAVANGSTHAVTTFAGDNTQSGCVDGTK